MGPITTRYLPATAALPARLRAEYQGQKSGMYTWAGLPGHTGPDKHTHAAMQFARDLQLPGTWVGAGPTTEGMVFVNRTHSAYGFMITG